MASEGSTQAKSSNLTVARFREWQAGEAKATGKKPKACDIPCSDFSLTPVSSYPCQFAQHVRFISHGLLANKQYFSLTLNQSTALSAMTYKSNQPKQIGRPSPNRSLQFNRYSFLNTPTSTNANNFAKEV